MNLLIFTFPLSALLIFGMAAGLGVFLTRKFGLGWRLYGIGAATFLLSQAGHIPFNISLTLLFRRGILQAPPAEWSLAFNAVVLGLSAGLWEELARYAVYRYWAKDGRSWGRGLLLGAGHGGSEAILIGGLILLTYVNMLVLQDSDLSLALSPEQGAALQNQVTGYWSTAWPASLMGAAERATTLVAHLAFSVLILQAFLRRQLRWVWVAVGWHALLDALAVYLAGTWGLAPPGVYRIEAVFGLLAVANLAIIFRLRSPEPVPEDALPEAQLPLLATKTAIDLHRIDSTVEGLEHTRYRELE